MPTGKSQINVTSGNQMNRRSITKAKERNVAPLMDSEETPPIPIDGAVTSTRVNAKEGEISPDLLAESGVSQITAYESPNLLYDEMEMEMSH